MTNAYRTNLTFDNLKAELEAEKVQIKVEDHQAYNYLLTDATSGEKFYFDKYAHGIEISDYKALWSAYDGQYLDATIEDVRFMTGTNKDGNPTKYLEVTLDVPDAKSYFHKYYCLEGFSDIAIHIDGEQIQRLKDDFNQQDPLAWVATAVRVKYSVDGDRDHFRIYSVDPSKTFEKPDYSPYEGMTCPVVGDISIKYEGTSQAGKEFAIFACDFKCGPVISHVEIFQSKNPEVGQYGTSQLDAYNRIKSNIARGLPASVVFKDPKWPKLKFEYPKKGEKRETAGMRLAQIKTA